MNLGKGVKKARKHLGMSQGTLSSRAGLTQTSISQIESGKTPHKSTLKKICNVLDCSEDVIYFLGFEETDFPKNRKQQFKQLFPAVEGLALQLVKTK